MLNPVFEASAAGWAGSEGFIARAFAGGGLFISCLLCLGPILWVLLGPCSVHEVVELPVAFDREAAGRAGVGGLCMPSQILRFEEVFIVA